MDLSFSNITFQESVSGEIISDFKSALGSWVSPVPLDLSIVDSQFEVKDKEGNKLLLDFLGDKELYGRIPRGKSELLAKALGLGKNISTVLDCTAGLGCDAVFMMRMGLHVQSLERNPLLYFLLKKSLERAQLTSKDFAKLFFYQGEAKNYINDLPNGAIDVFYIDPMYPEKAKSALPRQEMVLFRKLVGQDADAAEILELAINKAKDRVVVKRPLKGTHLGGLSPQHSFEGKTVRYDFYKSKFK
jgi:16S rRNA (guanine1516-N2)-methyltransferase